ncbi:MAG: translation initiation factor IF-2 [Euryarchaeota archaeon]|nr:translation initiation factor IF-2 [Euryarchaeota archaeon]
MPALRAPIVCVVGHVDHGKTTLLDKIRGTAVARREAGAITQHIGATEVTLETIRRLCGTLGESQRMEVPGLLFIDTPGHHAFTTLRARGSSLADLAVVVVDIQEGFQPQTQEMLKMLRRYQTPFLLAANKIDRLPMWNPGEGLPFLQALERQPDRAQKDLDERIYKMVGRLSENGFSGDRYDRVRDFQRNLCVVPVSAKTGEGLPDLLLVLVGLAQKFLEQKLTIDTGGPGRGTVLEVKEEKGLGLTMDVILWDGGLRRGDTIAVATGEAPLVTKVKAILRPAPEGRGTHGLQNAEEVVAAAGIKLVASNLEKAHGGLPFRVVPTGAQKQALDELQTQVEALRIQTDPRGIVIKADTFGSLEALSLELRAVQIPVRKAEVGDVTQRDITDAAAHRAKNPLLGAVLGFSVHLHPDVAQEAAQAGVPVFTQEVIYQLINDYREWVQKKREEMEQARLGGLTRAAKFKVLPGNVFRVSKPAIVGVRVLAGTLQPGAQLLRTDGREIGTLKSLQEQGKSIREARMGQEVAAAIDGPTMGRQLKEDDTLYTDLRENDVKGIRAFQGKVPRDELEALEEIVELKRKLLNNHLWGI